MAYSDWWWKYDVEASGSARGDLWDCALAITGHNVSDYRRGWPREARYGEYYTRRDFEELWAGREHLCPYYHDVEDHGFTDMDAEPGTEEEEGWVTTDSEDEGSGATDADGV